MREFNEQFYRNLLKHSDKRRFVVDISTARFAYWTELNRIATLRVLPSWSIKQAKAVTDTVERKERARSYFLSECNGGCCE